MAALPPNTRPVSPTGQPLAPTPLPPPVAPPAPTLQSPPRTAGVTPRRAPTPTPAPAPAAAPTPAPTYNPSQLDATAFTNPYLQSIYAPQARQQTQQARQLEQATALQQREQEKAAQETADRAKRDANNAAEATFRQTNRPFYTDSDGNIRPTQDDATFAQQQQETTQDAQRQVEWKKQGRTTWKNPVSGKVEPIEDDATFAAKQAEAATKRAAELRQKVIDDELDKTTLAASDPARAPLPVNARNAIEKEIKNTEEAARAALITKHSTTAKNVTGGNDWIPFNESPTQDATRSKERLTALQSGFDSNLSDEDLADLEADPTTAPAAAKLRTLRSRLQTDDENATWQQTQAEKAFDLKLKKTNPEEWSRRRADRLASLSPADHAKALEAEAGDFTTRLEEHQQQAAPLIATQQQFTQQLTDLETQAADARMKGIPAGEIVTLNGPDGPQDWPAALAETYLRTQQQVETWQTQNQDTLDLIQTRSQSLMQEQEALTASQAQAQEKAKAQRQTELQRLSQSPITRTLGEGLMALDTEAEQRRAALTAKFPDPESPQAKEALAALQTDLQTKSAALQEEATFRQTTAQQAYAGIKERIAADPQNPNIGQHFNEARQNLVDLLGITPKEADTILDDQHKGDWTFSNVPDRNLTQYLKDGGKLKEPTRILSTGDIVLNPELLANEQASKDAIAATTTTPAAKARALEILPTLRSKWAEAMLPAFTDKQSPFFIDFNEWRDGSILSKGKTAEGGAFARLKPSEQLMQYLDERAADHPAAKLARHIGTGLYAGFMDLTTQGLSLAAMGANYLPGVGPAISEGLSSLAQANQSNANTVTQTAAFDQSGLLIRGAGQGARILPSLAPSLAGGAIAQGALLAAARTTAGRGLISGVLAATSKAKDLKTAFTSLQTTTGLAGAGAAGAAQTAGAQYADIYGELRTKGIDGKPLTHEEAHQAAMMPALLSGAVTAILTVGFGATGAEKLLDASAKTAVKNRFTNFLKQVGKGAVAEQPEEILDEMFSHVTSDLAKNPQKDVGTSITEFIQTIPELAIAIGIMGGAGGGAAALRTPAAPKTSPEATAQGPDTTKLPEVIAAARAAIANYQPPAGSPLTPQAAAAVLEIAQGNFSKLTTSQLNALGWTRENGKLKPLKDYAGPPALEFTDKEQTTPILRQEILDQIDAALPELGDTIAMDEAEAREYFQQQQQNATAPAEAPDPGLATNVGGAAAPATATASPPADTAPPPATEQPAPADSQASPTSTEFTPVQAERTEQLTNHLTDLGLPQDAAEKVAAYMVRVQGTPGDSYNFNVIHEAHLDSPNSFKNILKKLGISGALTRQKAQENPLKAPADLDARLSQAAPPVAVAPPANAPAVEATQEPRGISAQGAAPPADSGVDTPQGGAEATPAEAPPATVSRHSPNSRAGKLAAMLVADGSYTQQEADEALDDYMAARPRGTEKMTPIEEKKPLLKFLANRENQQNGGKLKRAQATPDSTAAPTLEAAQAAAVASQPVGSRRRARRAMVAMNQSLAQWGKAFDRIDYSPAARKRLEGSGMAVDTASDGKIVLLVDLEEFAKQHSWSPTSRLLSADTLSEEIIHALAKTLARKDKAFTDPEMAKLWDDLTPKLRQTVWDAYHARPLSDNPDFPKAPPADASQPDKAAMAHEFLRMLVQKKAFTKRVTEEYGIDPRGLLARIAALLKKLSTALQDAIKGAPKDLQTRLEAYQSKLLDAANALTTTPVVKDSLTPAPAPKTAVTAEDNRAPVVIAGSPAPTAKGPASLTAGSTGTAYTDTNDAIDYEWAVVETNELTISNRDDGTVDPAYPQELQPRDRTSAGSEAQVQDIAKNANLDRLSASNTVGDGAPIIGPDGIVESGNGRTMGIRRAYTRVLPSAATYKQRLQDTAASYGLTSEAVAKMKAPMLVRVRTTNVDRAAFVKAANVSTISPKREIEQAKSDAKQIVPDLFETFVATEEGDIFTAANADFIRGFIAGVVPPAERPAIYDAKGFLSQTGLRRIRNALFVYAYGDSKSTLNALARLTEDIEADGRNLINALIALAPKFGEQNARIAAGALRPLSITADLAEALAAYQGIKERGETVENWVAQTTLPGVDDGPTDLQKALVTTLDSNRRSARKLIAVLNRYAAGVDGLGDPKQASLFGEEPTPTTLELWNLATTAEPAAPLATAKRTSPVPDAVKRKYANQMCHALTAALLERNPASQPFTAVTEDGEVFHSLVRLQNTQTFVDVEGAYEGISNATAAINARYNQLSGRLAPSSQEEVERMVVGVGRADRQRNINEAKPIARMLVNWVDSVQPAPLAMATKTSPTGTLAPANALKLYRKLKQIERDNGTLSGTQAQTLQRAEKALGQSFFSFAEPIAPSDFTLETETTGAPVSQAKAEQLRLFMATKRFTLDEALDYKQQIADRMEAELTPEFLAAVETSLQSGKPPVYPGLDKAMPSPNLDRENRIIEARFFQQIAENPGKAMAAYLRLAKEDFGNTRYLNADLARSVFPEYAANQNFRTIFDAATIAPAGYLTLGLLYPRFLTQRKNPNLNRVVMLAGGPSSGKTTVAHELLKDSLSEAVAIVDSVMGSVGGSRYLINTALQAGIRPTVYFVYRPFESAAIHALKRLVQSGRPVHVEATANLHYNAQKTFAELLKEYADTVVFRVLANDGTKEDIRLESLDFLLERAYYNADETPGNLARSYGRIVDNEYDQGGLTSAEHAAAWGRLGRRGDQEGQSQTRSGRSQDRQETASPESLVTDGPRLAMARKTRPSSGPDLFSFDFAAPVAQAVNPQFAGQDFIVPTFQQAPQREGWQESGDSLPDRRIIWTRGTEKAVYNAAADRMDPLPDLGFTSLLTPAQQQAKLKQADQLDLFATPNNERTRPTAPDSRRPTNPIRRPERDRTAKPAPERVLGELFDLVAGQRKAERDPGMAGRPEGEPSETSGQQGMDAGDSRADGQTGGSGSPQGNLSDLGQLPDARGGSGSGRGDAEGTTPGTDRPRKKSPADRTPALKERPAKGSPGRNIAFTRDAELSPRGLRSKLKANLEALRIVKAVETEGRLATAEEKQALIKFSGWGALSQAFDDDKADRVENGEIETRRNTASFNRSQAQQYPRNAAYYLGQAETQEEDAQKLENWKNQWNEAHLQIRDALTDQEYRAAKRSTINAHFTSPEYIGAMWDIAEWLGFKGGNVLEPGAGIGHFFGLMPENLADRSNLFGVELDAYTAKILAILYPEADIQNTGFQTADIADNSIDLGISNVPFANVPVVDKALEAMGGPVENLHDYFFGKALTKLKPGGVQIFITSAFTMDKGNPEIRKWLAERADLVAAFRLPNDAFKENAGTDVVTDIIVLRKKDGKPFPHAQDWSSLGDSVTRKGEPIRINQYFASHPQNILGLLDNDGSMFAARDGEPDRKEMTVHSDPARPPRVILQQAIATLPRDIFGSDATQSQARTGLSAIKAGNVVSRDGKFYFQGQENPDKNLNDPKNASRVKAFLQVRDALNEQYDLELSDTATAEEIEANRFRLNQAYDRFVSRFENFHDKKNKGLLIDDPDYFRLLGAEVEANRDKGAAAALLELAKRALGKRKYVKADIFKKRVLEPRVEPTTANNLEDAFGIALGWRGRVDIGFIASLTDQTPEQVERALLERELAVRDPESGQILSREQYLAGNVRKKLEIAEASGPDYRRNVQLLKPVQPQDVSIQDIRFKIGATWIPPQIYSDFLSSLGIQNVKLTYTTSKNGEGTDRWEIDDKKARWNGVAYKDFETRDMEVLALMDSLLNLNKIAIYSKDKDGKRTLEAGATAQAKETAKKLNAKFIEWARSNENAATQMAAIYNKEVNSHAQRTYDGQFLTFPWANKDFDIFPDKKNTIWRAIQDGFGLIAHGVGGGKTIIGSAIALEMRRLGMARKPMIVVHNSTLEGFAKELAQMAPAARVLVGRKDELQGEKRKEFLMRIAAGDWDAVVIAHSTFSMIADDPNVEIETRQNVVDEMMESLKDSGYDSVLAAKSDRQKSPTVKNLIKQIERMEAAIEKATNRVVDEGLLNFQQLGIDALIVDEIHEFKKMPFSTKQDAKGVDGTFSEKGYALMMRARQIQSKMGGKNIFTMTGTPVTNTLGEIWNMVRLVAPHLMKEYKIEHFDQFVSKFAEVETVSEMGPTGEFKLVDRLSKVVNLPEWATFLRMAADVKLGDSLVVKNRPGIKGGKPELVAVPRSPGVSKWVDYIRNVLAEFEGLTGKDLAENPRLTAIPVQAYMASRAAAIDIRLIEPRAKDEPNSKVNVMLDRLMGIYERTSAYQGTQVIFADSFNQQKISLFDDLVGTNTLGIEIDPTKEVGTTFNLYEDIRAKLIARGVPESEIAVITDAKWNDDKRKQALFEMVNEGKVRIIIGSTQRLGTGVNMQRRMAAGHHLDVPWTPAGLEQRDGRVFRQGNIHGEMGVDIELIRYGMKDTLDAALWQKLETKQRFITLSLSGKIVGRELEEVDEIMTLAEQRAVLSGPYGQQIFELETRLKELDAARQGFEDESRTRNMEIAGAANYLRVLTEQASRLQPSLAKMERVGASVQKDGIKIAIDGQTFDTKAETTKALDELMQSKRDAFELAQENQRSTASDIASVTVNGIPVYLKSSTIISYEFDLETRKEIAIAKTRWHLLASPSDSSEDITFGTVASSGTLFARLEELTESVQSLRSAMDANTARTRQLSEMSPIGAWPLQAEYDETIAKLQAVRDKLRGSPEAATAPASLFEPYYPSASTYYPAMPLAMARKTAPVDDSDIQGYLDLDNVAVPASQHPAAKRAIRAAEAASTQPYPLPNARGSDGNRDRLGEVRERALRAWRGLINADPGEIAAAFAQNKTISSLLHDFVRQDIPSFDIRGAIIQSPADFAAFQLAVRSPYFESLKIAIIGDGDQVIHSEVAHVGSLNESIADPKRIATIIAAARIANPKQAIQGYIIAHNHPSGNPSPSDADRRTTRRFVALGEMLGVPLIDHVVTNGSKYFSFREAGMVSSQPSSLTDSSRPRKPKLPILPTPEAQSGAVVGWIDWTRLNEGGPTIPNASLADWEVVPSLDTQSRPSLDSPDKSAAILKGLRTADPDHHHLIYLDTRYHIRAVERVSKQESTAKIIQTAILGTSREGAFGFMLGSSHESSDPTPSAAHSRLVRSLKEAASNVSIPFFDSIITAKMGVHFSYREAGMMETPAMPLAMARKTGDNTQDENPSGLAQRSATTSQITGGRLTPEQGQAVSDGWKTRLQTGLRESGIDFGSRTLAQSLAAAFPGVPILTTQEEAAIRALPVNTDGAEAKVYIDRTAGIVYKRLADGNDEPSAGIWPILYTSDDGSGKLDWTFDEASRARHLGIRLGVMTAIGSTPTEIHGFSSEGHIYLKQPLSPNPSIGSDRASYDNDALAVARRRSGIIEIPSALLPRYSPRAYIVAVGGRPWFVTDLQPSNFIGDNQGDARINDPVIGQIPADLIAKVPGLASVVKQAIQEETRLGDRSARLFAAPKTASPVEPGFYSQLAETLRAKMPARAGKDQITSIIKGGGKAEEVKWSGILPWVDAQTGPIEREAVLAYLEGEGAVKFKEVTNQDVSPMTLFPFNEWLKDNGLTESEYDNLFSEGQQKVKREYAQFLNEKPAPPQTKFAQYQLPGGENYREVVLAMPPPKVPQKIEVVRHPGGRGFALRLQGGSLVGGGDNPTQFDSRDAAENRGIPYYQKHEYTSSHFPNVPNYVAHMRTNERTDAQGNPGLFLEELQSDRHQKGRSDGYGETFAVVSPRPLMEGGGTKEVATFDTREEAATYVSENRSPLNKLQIVGKSGVPDAPFRSTWPLQLFKRALRDAVAGGMEWIGWTTGETQAERYKLSKQVDRIRWQQKQPGKLNGIEQPLAKIVTIDLKQEDKLDIVVDTDGTVATVLATRMPEIKGKPLADVIGKDMAKRILETDSGDLSGEGLNIGGEGMKGFYDTILPKELGKYVKQWGATVEKSSMRRRRDDTITVIPSPDGKEWAVIGTGREEAPKFSTKTKAEEYAAGFRDGTREGGRDIPIWRIAITPAMRESVQQGQPLFAAPKTSTWPAMVATANDMSIQEFVELAKQGRLQQATGRPGPLDVGSQTTPLSLGASAGYSLADIAHFYIARRVPRDGNLNALLNSTQDPANNPFIVSAFDEFAANAAIESTSTTPIDTAAHTAATSPQNATPQPTDAQKRAGNYKVGRVQVGPLDISIENPAGSTRSGTDPNGKAWSIIMLDHYGYVRGTQGKDGDHIDIFIQPGTPTDYTGPVFVVNQTDTQGNFDEHKAVMGPSVQSESAARAEYLQNYSPGWKGAGTIARFDSVQAFADWATERRRMGPAKPLPAAPKTNPLAALGWNHLDKSLSSKLASHTRWMNEKTGAGETVAAWMQSEKVKPFTALGTLIKRELFPDTVLPREITARLREMNVKSAMGAQRAMDLTRALSGTPKFSDIVYPPSFTENPLHRRHLYEAMAGMRDMASLPQELQDLATRLRRMLVEIGQEAVKQGRMSLDTFEGLRENYMPHFYEEDVAREKSFLKRFVLGVKDIFAQRTTAWHIVDTKTKDKTGEPRLVSYDGNRWRFKNKEHRDAWYEEFIAKESLDRLQSRDKRWRSLTLADLNKRSALPDEARGRLQEIENALRAQFRKEKPLSLAEQEKAGLILDPVYSIARYAAQMVHDNSTAEFFNFVASKPEWISDTATPGFTQVPDNTAFGRLAGKYVENDIHRQLTEMVEAPNAALRLYDTVLSWWKTGKTVLNPGTHVRNVLGNIPFATFAGVNPLNPGNMGFYRDALRHLRNGGQTLTEAYEDGVLGADFVSAELRQTLRQLLPDPATIDESDRGESILLGIGKAIGQVLPNWAKNPTHKAYNQIAALYQVEDEIYKMAAYLKARAMGMTREEATAHVRHWFPYYDLATSASLKLAQRTGMPFLSFYRESIRIFGHALTERPLALATTLAIPSIITALSAMALGLDDDDLEQLRKDMRGKAGKLLGPTPLGGYPLFSMLLPVRSANGDFQQFDLSAIHPFADMLGNRVETDKTEDWWQQTWRSMLTAGPIGNLVYAQVTGRDAFGDRPFVEDNMTAGEKLAARLDNAAKTALPPLTPFVGTGYQTLANAGSRSTNKTLEVRSPAQAILRAVGGLDVRNANPDIYRLAEDWRKTNNIPTTEGMDFSATTPTSRARKALFTQLANPEPNLAAIKNLTDYLEKQGSPVKTADDVRKLLFYRNPLMVIRGRENQQRFRASLTGQERTVLETALSEFEKIQARAPSLILQARAQ
jgi:N12 class adenine-specific DNA methylase/DNA repair protein RadC